MKNAPEIITSACNSSQLKSWGVLNRDGVFYATSPVGGEESPFEIALHGVRSESEAQLAIALFAAPQPLAFSN